MLLSWIFGLALIHSVGAELLSALWMQVKFFLVIILTAYHFYLGSCLRAFSQDRIHQARDTLELLMKYKLYINFNSVAILKPLGG